MSKQLESTTSNQLTLFVGGHHVNRPHAPGSEEEQRMTVGSGRRLLESFPRSALNGSFSKTLLEYLVYKAGFHSNKCYLTWKHKVTPFRRSYCQLAPSMPRTGGIGSGFLHTPDALDRRSAKSKQQGVSNQIAMLPTPRSGKMTGEDAENWTARQQAGKVSTPPLELAINMLPTPSASMMTMEDMEQARYAGNGGKRPKYANALLPTPKTRDWKGETQRGPDAPGDGIQNFLAASEGITKQTRGQKTGTPLRLEPAFVIFLMGYPKDWLDV